MKLKSVLKFEFWKKRKLIFSLFLILLIILPISFFFFKKEVAASWWNDAWHYRKSIAVNNSSGGTLTDFQVKILTNYDLSGDISNGKIQTDLDDLRFTTNSGEALDYWIEDATNNSVDVWLKIPSLSTGGATIYFYYGNPQAGVYSDGNKVFDFFDDFNIFDETKWEATGNKSVVNGKMTVTTGAVYSKNTVAITPQNKTIEMKAKYLNSAGIINDYSGISISDVQGTSISNSSGDAIAYNMTIDESDYYLNIYGSNGASADYNIINDYILYYQALNTDYIIGYTFQGSSNIKYFSKDLAYNDLGSTTPAGTWNYPFYLWLGGYRGSNSGIQDIDDVEVDWVRVRKYASADPTTGTFGSEEKSQAPVGYWSFDEGYGTTAHDESSFKNNGTINGATWKNESECLAGKCLYFDGTDDYVDLGNSNVTQFDGGNYDFSLSAWIKPNSVSNNDRTVIGRWGSIASDQLWILKIESDNASAKWAYHNVSSGGAEYYSVSSPTPSSMETNKWYHLTGVKSGTVMNLYINGVLVATDNSLNGNIFNGVSNLLLGYGNYSDNFQGFIDEVKIYDYARTANQIKQDYNSGLAGQSSAKGATAAFGSKSDKWLTDGLVGHWKMDESSWNGTVNEVKDASGNNNHGTAQGGAITGAGKFGNGGNFVNSSSQYIYLNNSTNYDLTSSSQMTVSAWVKTPTSIINNFLGIVKRGNPYAQDASDQYALRSANNMFQFSLGNGSSYVSINSPTINVDSWYHLIGVVDSNKAYLYMNGKLVGEQSRPSGSTPVSNFTAIGAMNSNQKYWDGNIDEVRIYNRALSPDEVKKLYEYAPGPVLHLKMDEKNGTTAFDSSGNNNHGTLTNGPIWETGKIGSALGFDGVDDMVTVNDSTSWDIGTGDFTVNTQVMFADNYEGVVFGLDNYTNGIMFYVYQGTTYLWVANDWTSYTWVPDKNKWYHVNILRTGGIVKTYINGLQIGTNATLGGNVNTSQGLRLGYGFTGSANKYLKGKIDNFQLYNYARTQEQILQDMSAQGGSALGGGSSKPQSPILDLNFDEGYGDTAYDKSISKNNGTLNSGTTGGNTTTSAMWSKEGKNSGAMEFDGADDYLSITDNAKLNFGSNDSFSISMWIKTNSNSEDDEILEKQIGIPLYQIVYSSNNFTTGRHRVAFDIRDSSGNYTYVEGTTAVNDNIWHHIVAVRDVTRDKIYIYTDGKSNSATDISTSTLSNATNLRIGGGNSGYFNGLTDEVKIYNYALGEDEVKALYNGGSSMSMGGEVATANNNGTTVAGDATEYCIPGDTAKCDKPIGEWSFDEKSEVTLYDKSGSGNNGTLANGPIWERGKVGGAVKFDGTDDYVSILDNTNSYDLSKTYFTASAWVKLPAIGSEQYIFSRKGSVNRGWSLKISSTGAITVYGYGVANSGHSTFDNVRNNSLYYIYVDGSEKPSAVTVQNAPQAGSGNLYIGAAAPAVGLPTLFSSQYIDEVRIYDYARTPSQIAWDYNRGKPVAHWKMDEGEGTIAHDENVNQNSSTIAGATWQNENICKKGKCLSFDGDNDSMVTSGNIDLSKTDKASIAFWFKYTSVGSVMAELSSNHNSNEAFMVYNSDEFNGTIELVDHCGSTYNSIITTNSHNDNNWHHFVGVIDRSLNSVSENKIYIDGEKANSTMTINYECSGNFGSYPFYLGARGGTTFDYTGSLDDVKIFNYALTPEQVKQDYAGGAVNFK